MRVARQRLFDTMAISASALCLVHCLALPVLVMLPPALAAYLALPESFHIGALLFAAPTSIVALAAAYRRHRWALPTRLAAPALALLALGAFVAPEEWIETLLTVTGAIALAVAHALNWRALPHGHPHDGRPA